MIMIHVHVHQTANLIQLQITINTIAHRLSVIDLEQLAADQSDNSEFRAASVLLCYIDRWDISSSEL